MAKKDLCTAIQKSKEYLPLNETDLDELSSVDYYSLISEHGLDFEQASRVMSWNRHEALRDQFQRVTWANIESDHMMSETYSRNKKKTIKITPKVLREIILAEKERLK